MHQLSEIGHEGVHQIVVCWRWRMILRMILRDRGYRGLCQLADCGREGKVAEDGNQKARRRVLAVNTKDACRKHDNQPKKPISKTVRLHAVFVRQRRNQRQH